MAIAKATITRAVKFAHKSFAGRFIRLNIMVGRDGSEIGWRLVYPRKGQSGFRTLLPRGPLSEIEAKYIAQCLLADARFRKVTRKSIEVSRAKRAR